MFDQKVRIKHRFETEKEQVFNPLHAHVWKAVVRPTDTTVPSKVLVTLTYLQGLRVAQKPWQLFCMNFYRPIHFCNGIVTEWTERLLYLQGMGMHIILYFVGKGATLCVNVPFLNILQPELWNFL